jgi:ABC-2 type transport system ATP-binding protein
VSACVEVRAVTKRYGTFIAVDELSFEVPRGVIYGVLGPNGAGKTTTLRMLNDILGPDEGTIRLLGRLPPGREAARHIGYLPEERGLYPKMKVREMLGFLGELRGLRRGEARERADAWLARLDLAGWADKKVQDLSKGMQQKVQFAGALIHEPELVILDEPWSGLDPLNADLLREVVLEQRSAGRTVLFSTHLMEQAEKICDAVCIIARGRKVLDGALDRLKREAAAERLVAISFAREEDLAAAEPVLSDPALIASVERRDGGLELDVEVELVAPGGARALLERLVAAGAEIRRFERVEPTLHDIFVSRVGAEGARERV